MYNAFEKIKTYFTNSETKYAFIKKHHELSQANVYSCTYVRDCDILKYRKNLNNTTIVLRDGQRKGFMLGLEIRNGAVLLS